MATRFAADRFVYAFSPNKALTSGVGITLDVFVDEACLTLATLTTVGGIPIAGARIVVDTNSLFPEFLDLADHGVLYVRPVGSIQSNEIRATVPDQIATTVAAYIQVHPPFLPLGMADPVPSGTPDGTLIIRF